jgi:ABC-type transport system involved in cytochrome c biogenesis ATPase subunit
MNIGRFVWSREKSWAGRQKRRRQDHHAEVCPQPGASGCGERENPGHGVFRNHEDSLKQQLGYAVGGMSYYKRKKVRDITAITKTFYDNWDADAYAHYRTVFQIDDNKRIMELSEGMKVKFYLTMALSHHAKLLILDEPTSGLDPVSRDELTVIFRKLAEKGVADSVLHAYHQRPGKMCRRNHLYQRRRTSGFDEKERFHPKIRL